MQLWIVNILERTKKPLVKFKYLIALPIICGAGATLIELALLLPVFLILILGTLEYCVREFASEQLDAGVSLLARQGQTGQLINTPYTPAGMDAALLAQLVPAFLFSANQLTVSAEHFNTYQLEPCVSNVFWPCLAPGQYQDLNGDGIRDFLGGAPGTGDAGDVVLYSATYQWTGFTPVWNLLNLVFGGGNNNTTTLISNVIVQNEPFPGR